MQTPTRIAILGHGYVGQATSHALSPIATVRWHDPARPGSEPLDDLLAWAELIFVCVPTPSGPDGSADLTAVREALDALAERDVRAPILLKSTLPPGATEALAAERPGLALAAHPEFLRERHHLADAESPARLVFGWTTGFGEAHRERVRSLFGGRFPAVPQVELSATQAELLKLSANALFGVKVSLANELAELAAALGEAWEPVRAGLVLDPRVGDGHLAVPGPDGELGFGGACLPKDLAALLASSARRGQALPVVEAALSANRERRPTSIGPLLSTSPRLPPTLHTARLVLDAPTVDDFAGYARIVTTERGRYIGGPFDEEEAWLDYSQMVAGWTLRGYGALTIRRRGERGYLGTVLVHHEWGDPAPELGCLLVAEAEGQGIAREAGEAMLRWAWEHTTIERLASFVDPENARAVAALVRGGARLGPEAIDGAAVYWWDRPGR